MLFFHYGIQKRDTRCSARYPIAALLGPRFDQFPIFPEKLILAGAVQKGCIQLCGNGQPTQVVCIGAAGNFFIREVIAPGLFCDA
jgi:hypothetical protein